MDILGTLLKLWNESGFAAFFMDGGWKNLVMIIIAFVLLYLGIVKKFEPLLLCGIAFGCLLSNLSYFVAVGGANAMYHPELWADFLNEASPYYHSYGHILANAGLLDVFYIGVKAGIYPSLIFMGVGAMTDFGPMIANPKSMLMGASAQLGVFVAFFGAVMLGFTGPQGASIGIIGGADGPTAIYLTTKLAPELLGPRCSSGRSGRCRTDGPSRRTPGTDCPASGSRSAAPWRAAAGSRRPRPPWGRRSSPPWRPRGSAPFSLGASPPW